MRRRFRYGSVKKFDGFVMNAFGLGYQAEKVKNIGVFGGSFENLPVQAFGFVKPSLFVQGQRLLKHQVIRHFCNPFLFRGGYCIPESEKIYIYLQNFA